MKRLLFICALIIITINFFISPVALAQATENEEQRIAVLLDGVEVAFDVPPVIKNGRVLVPFRAIAEALNVTVNWENDTRTITAIDDKTNISLQLDNKVAFYNGTPTVLDVVPQIHNDRALVPLRFFSETFNCQVFWEASTNNIKITSPPKKMHIVGFYALGDSKTSSWTNLFGKPYPELSRGNTDMVSELALGWYSIDKEGNLLTDSKTGWQKPSGWEHVLEAAEKYGLKTEMVIHVTDKGSTIASILESEDAVNNAVNGIIEEAKLYQGINLDFEGLGFQDEGEQLKTVRDSFNQFIEILSQQAKDSGLSLTLTLHPPNSAYKGYDYQNLGKMADKIIIMAYDYGTKPEPNSLVIQAVEEALKDVTKDRLILGISIPSENPESIRTKVGIAKKYGLEGIALWRLGLLTEEMWDSLRETLETTLD
ncbi:MAG: stalk domain-containing protein [Bacillota bacterium]